MKSSILRLFSVLFLFLAAFSAKAADFEGKDDFSAVYRLGKELSSSGIVGMVQSPADSSIWVATGSKGLVRIGRNGRRIDYRVSNGQLPCDSLVDISVDTAGTVSFTDIRGRRFAYSALTGITALEGTVQKAPADTVSFSNSLPFENATLADNQIVTSRIPAWFILLFVLAVLCCALLLFLFLRERKFNADRDELHELTDASSFSHSPVAPLKTSPEVAVKVPATSATSVAPAAPVAPVAPAVPAAPLAPVAPVEAPVKSSEISSAEAPVRAHVEVSPTPKVVSPAVFPEKKPVPTPSSPGSFLSQVNSLIQKNYSDPDFGVEQIAAALGITRVHLNRKLKAESDASPSALLKAERMKHASELLLRGDVTVADISKSCGFSTQSYFSTAFRDYFGQTPSEYVLSRKSAPGSSQSLFPDPEL